MQKDIEQAGTEQEKEQNVLMLRSLKEGFYDISKIDQGTVVHCFVDPTTGTDNMNIVKEEITFDDIPEGSIIKNKDNHYNDIYEVKQ